VIVTSSAHLTGPYQTRLPAEVRMDAVRRASSSALLPEVGMSSDYPTILLAGRDPGLLLLRSAVLASTGLWSVRVRNAVQASQVLEFVSCDLAVIGYTLEENEKKKAHQRSAWSS